MKNTIRIAAILLSAVTCFCSLCLSSCSNNKDTDYDYDRVIMYQRVQEDDVEGMLELTASDLYCAVRSFISDPELSFDIPEYAEILVAVKNNKLSLSGNGISEEMLNEMVYVSGVGETTFTGNTETEYLITIDSTSGETIINLKKQ